MSVIWAESAVETLRKLGEEFSDYVDPNSRAEGCRYIENGAPSCIVGTALVRMGFDVNEIAELDTEDRGHSTRIGNSSSYLVTDRLSAEAVEVLSRAQSVQDGGGTWGEAATHAIEFYESMFMFDIDSLREKLG